MFYVLYSHKSCELSLKSYWVYNIVVLFTILKIILLSIDDKIANQSVLLISGLCELNDIFCGF